VHKENAFDPIQRSSESGSNVISESFLHWSKHFAPRIWREEGTKKEESEEQFAKAHLPNWKRLESGSTETWKRPEQSAKAEAPMLSREAGRQSEEREEHSENAELSICRRLESRSK
jgi:hypothetical protein